MAMEFESNVVVVSIIFWHAFNRDRELDNSRRRVNEMVLR
jgi:hypothetical protein